MAYVSVSTGASFNIKERIAEFVAAQREALAKRRLYRRTLNELSSLSSRELADLGLSSHNLRQIAYEAAYLAK